MTSTTSLGFVVGETGKEKKRWHRIEVPSNPISLPDSKICVSFESLTGFSCCCLEDLGLECEDCS